MQLHYSGCLPTGTMSAHLLPPPWNPAYLTIFRQTDQIIGLVPRGRAPMARRRNRFCSALLDDYCAALVAGHDPMHRWVTGRRSAGKQGGGGQQAGRPSGSADLQARGAPTLPRPGQAELYRPGPTPVYFWRSAREWASSCCSLPSRPAGELTSEPE